MAVAVTTALLVALVGAGSMWMMGQALLEQRKDSLRSETIGRASDLSEFFGRQLAWMQTLADDVAAMEQEGAGPEAVAQELRRREGKNGNLTNIRACIGEVFYEEGEAAVPDEGSEEAPVSFKKRADVAEWYQIGSRGTGGFLEPAQRDGRDFMTVAVPVWREGTVAGVVAADLLLNDLLQNVSRMSLFGGGYAMVVDQSGKPLIDRPPSVEVKTVYGASMPTLYEGVKYTKDVDGVKRYIAVSGIDGPKWKFYYAVDRWTLLRPLLPVIWMILLASLTGAGLSALLVSWRLGNLTEPLAELQRGLREMRKGNYKLKIAYDKADEFGELCRAIEETCAATAQRVDEISHLMARMAQGDFTVKAGEDYPGDFAPIGQSIDQIAGALHQVFKQINVTAKWALGGSHQVSGVSGRLSAGVESQSNSVEELGKAATLLRHESNQNALNAGKAQEMALSAGAEIRESFRQVQFLRENLDAAVRNIGTLKDMLERVSRAVSQGRMLSISTSAEAERAGEQAQAFSIAVDELRELFVAAQKEASEADGLVKNAFDALKDTQDQLEKTTGSMRSVTKKNGQSMEYISRIASAAQLQAQAAAKMSKEVSVISVVAQSNAQLAEQFDQSTSALSDQAKVLSGMAAAFYTKGEASEDEKSAPIIFDEDSGGFSVTGEK